ncbi:class I SAM-dependent methyltransferase [Flexivirga caeni]|uniref:class I SAM-dependent methyltransferase n=1 Tax=Flexivirga caeni TaxID=2294115 RepID=UPI0013156436|nr:class I SAM-dependent methyltransferase [Flexivirga caeni]
MPDDGLVDGIERVRELAVGADEGASPWWYEQLYAEARVGASRVPWDHGEPTPYLVAWLRERFPSGRGSGRAVVVGCAYGDDAELVASYGFAVTAFDISASAVETARSRHPASAVDYRQADLLGLPEDWRGAFDLVVECTTLQSTPVALHERGAVSVASLCAVDGKILVIARCPADGDPPGPPWLLSEREVWQVAAGGVRLSSLQRISMRGGDRWVGEFVCA